jgi:hypothetical protein
MAMIMAAAAVPVVSTEGSGVAAAAVPSCSAPGVITTSGITVSLTQDCSTTAPLTPVPNGFTFNGNNHTISFSDPPGGHFSGAVLTNAGASMNVENVTIAGPPSGLAVPTDCSLLLFGILFGPGAAGAPGVDASGTVNNVRVENVFQMPTTAFGSCQVGHAIRANAFVSDQKVTITNTTVTGYQKGGLTASGAGMTMVVSNSTVGPPASLEGFIAQNGVQFGGSSGGTSGSISNSTIWGSGDQAAGPGGSTSGTAVLLFTAKNVTVDHNTITGPKTDLGISVTANSTNITISFNKVGRTAPDTPDPAGIGIEVTHAEGDLSSATLICNTFSGWNKNIVGAIQISCTPLPEGPCGSAYSAELTVEGGTAPFTWSASGALPPGLRLASTGAITGTPTMPGTYPFTAHVADSSHPPLSASQGQSITISTGSCAEEVGENPSIPESSEPGEAPPAPITPGKVPVTG